MSFFVNLLDRTLFLLHVELGSIAELLSVPVVTNYVLLPVERSEME